MKDKFGLLLPEQRVGLAAHDFAQLASAPDVLLTRARRNGTSPTVPSRFLLQIETVLSVLGYITKDKDILQPAEPWAAWARMLDEPTAEPVPITPPKPCPPVAARPRTLSVTRIGAWLHNPYEIYARSILRLKKLDDLERAVDAKEHGTLLHAALEDFINQYKQHLPSDAYHALITCGEKHFAAYTEHAQVKAIWWPRFKRLARWFIDLEYKRRANGTIVLGVESQGTLQLGDFTLTGRADRIDKLAEGRLELIDYKSGQRPADKQVTLGNEPQLPLLALIAARGGFAADKIAPTETASLAYWKINGRDGGEEKALDVAVAKLIEEAEQGVMALVALYRDPSMPYLAAPRPSLAPNYDDYAHLARRAEWGHLTGGDA